MTALRFSRIPCYAHGAALAAEHGVQFPPALEAKP